MFYDKNLKLAENYFFGTAVVSLVTAFYLLLNSIELYYMFIFLSSINFSVSFLLILSITKKIKDIYILDTKKYIFLHSALAIVVGLITTISIIYFQETVTFIAYFVGINLFVMFAILAKLIIWSVNEMVNTEINPFSEVLVVTNSIR